MRTIQQELGYTMVPIFRRTPREEQLSSCNFTAGGIPIAPEKMLDTHIATDLIGDATFDVYDIGGGLGTRYRRGDSAATVDQYLCDADLTTILTRADSQASATNPGRGTAATTNATTDSPQSGSGLPTTATARTSARVRSASSTSRG